MTAQYIPNNIVRDSVVRRSVAGRPELSELLADDFLGTNTRGKRYTKKRG
jgi:hypothetical protein